MFPKQIKLHESSKLFLAWDDNSETIISLDKLRKFCPCATCVTERENQNESYISIYYSDQFKIQKINPVGKYAIGITWKDGHNTGIYEFPFLKNLSGT